MNLEQIYRNTTVFKNLSYTYSRKVLEKGSDTPTEEIQKLHGSVQMEVSLDTPESKVLETICNSRTFSTFETKSIEVDLKGQLSESNTYQSLGVAVISNQEVSTVINIEGEEVELAENALVSVSGYHAVAQAKLALGRGEDTFPIVINGETREIDCYNVCVAFINLNDALLARTRQVHKFIDSYNLEEDYSAKDIKSMIEGIITSTETPKGVFHTTPPVTEKDVKKIFKKK